MDSGAYKVFPSYNDEDRSVVADLARRLRGEPRDAQRPSRGEASGSWMQP